MCQSASTRSGGAKIKPIKLKMNKKKSGTTGIEPAASGLTDQRANQLRHVPFKNVYVIILSYFYFYIFTVFFKIYDFINLISVNIGI